MPAAIAINVKALREREPDHDSLKRYTEVAVMLTGCVQLLFLWAALPLLELQHRAMHDQRFQIILLTDRSSRPETLTD